MTIVEFVHPIKGKPTRDLCLAALYFAHRYNSKEALSVEEIRTLLKRARVARATRLNLADVLAKSAPFVDIKGKQGHRLLWALTPTGEDHVRVLLGLPASDVEIEHDVSTLQSLASSISDKMVSDYVREALTCLSVGALRAAVVFLWAGAARRIQERLMPFGSTAVTAAIHRFDPAARRIARVDDFAYVKESTQLLAAQELGLFDKNQRGILEEALNLRNKCGHPGIYKPGPKKVSGTIEDIIGVLFT